MGTKFSQRDSLEQVVIPLVIIFPFLEASLIIYRPSCLQVLGMETDRIRM